MVQRYTVTVELRQSGNGFGYETAIVETALGQFAATEPTLRKALRESMRRLRKEILSGLLVPDAEASS